MSIDQIAPEALKLPARERAMLAASLWDSIGDPFDAVGDLNDEASIALAIERDAELDSGAVQPISHEEFMRRVRR